MRTLTLLVIALACVPPGRVAAQRRARIGPTVSSISIEDGSGSSHSFTSFGASVAFLTGDDGELGIGVSRYGDLSSNNCVRQMSFVALECHRPGSRDGSRRRLPGHLQLRGTDK